MENKKKFEVRTIAYVEAIDRNDAENKAREAIDDSVMKNLHFTEVEPYEEEK